MIRCPDCLETEEIELIAFERHRLTEVQVWRCGFCKKVWARSVPIKHHFKYKR